MIKKIALLVILFLGSFVFVQAQQNKKLIQFSGVVVNGDSLQPIPFVNIMIKNSYHGTVSDYYGYSTNSCLHSLC